MVDITKKQGWIGAIAALLLTGIVFIAVDDGYTGQGYYKCEALDGVPVFEFDRISKINDDGISTLGYPTSGTRLGSTRCSSGWNHVLRQDVDDPVSIVSKEGCKTGQTCYDCIDGYCTKFIGG